MEDEQMQILGMVEEGKVTPEEGARLLDAIRARAQKNPPSSAQRSDRALRVRVVQAGGREGESGEKIADISVPLALAPMALKLIPRSALTEMEKEGVSADDLKELLNSVEALEPRRIVDITKDGKRISVFIE